VIPKTTSQHGIRLAISTCPNDTFAFHAILNNRIDLAGLDFDIELLDIQQLNDGLFNDQFDVAKASFHAAALLSSRTLVLPSGSALGFGVGPMLLAASPAHTPAMQSATASPTLTLCPGQHTTAAMLFQMFYGDAITNGLTHVEHGLFSEIMPKLKLGQADFGVCIHEGRFTWKQQGLHLVEDLGTRWELETGSPLPLGGILVRRNLEDELIGRIQAVIQASIRYGLGHRAETLETMRAYAQELDDDVLFSHVDLYVNDWTVDLGSTGSKSLQQLSKQAKNCGLISEDCPDIQIWKNPRS
jgi:1,4-dihydroxy-6-naphthoate synthase